MAQSLHKSSNIEMALKHDTCIFPHRLHDNHSFQIRDACLLVVSKVGHSSGIPRKDCNIVNNTICSTTTLLIDIRVVVGGLEAESRIHNPDTRTATWKLRMVPGTRIRS